MWQADEGLVYADLSKVVIDPKLPRQQRIAAFVEQVGDPYHVSVGKITVEICFDESQPTLDKQLEQYLCCQLSL